MRSHIFTLVAAFALTGMSVALPAEHDAGYYNFLSRRAVSPDNTCGIVMGQTAGYSCDASVNEGGCCSQYGYCGNSSCKLFVSYYLINYPLHKGVMSDPTHCQHYQDMIKKSGFLLTSTYGSILRRRMPKRFWSLRCSRASPPRG